MLNTPPILALFITVAFIFFLLRRDFREARNVTTALWLPLLWILVIGSRPLSQWLHTFGVSLPGPSTEEEGNPIDALVYFTLIASGVYVLNKRQVSLSEVFRNNSWLIAFLLYCFLAIVWADYPFVAFKRWIKILGHPIMALIVLSEPNPQESLTRLMKRSAYILLPLSMLVIKYYEGIGRRFDEWTGLASNRGICNTKNGLGAICMIFGYFFFWQLLKTWRSERSRARRDELYLIGGVLIMVCWLTRKAHSMTPFLTMLIAMLVMALLNLRWVNKRLIGTYVILATVTLVAAQLSFGIFEMVVDLTGHVSTISGRELLWGELLAFQTNPVFGTGFESFWSGDRLRAIWETHWWHPNEAHNGYLETYLNLGVIGLFMLAGVIIATFRKIRLELFRNLEWGRFRMGFLLAVVAYNGTEATFKGLNLVWFVFYIIALEFPNLRFTSMEPSPEEEESEEEMELAYLPDGNRNL
jgi:exopolysaccharide production protein ExoQ